ncbi:hypothetical protein FPV67DRAFT_171778 [Lyophyllum atratum]|nr:hypothetical protein FPV67DRAFT_171778 [Lyophyllum atratum]
MDLQTHVESLPTSQSMPCSPRRRLGPHSMESPNKNRGKYPVLQESASLLSTYPASRTVEEIGDTTLYFVSPSYADLTACASGILNSLSSSSTKLFKTVLPPAISVVQVAPRRCHAIATSTSLGASNHISSDFWPLDSHQDLFPSIPSVLSSMQHIDACDISRRTSPPRILSYGIIGTIGKGTYGKVVLACLKDDWDGDLYAVKIVRTQGKHEIEAELATLQLISGTSRTSNDDGLLFLQRIQEAFRDEASLFIVLVRHLDSLAPDP